MAEIGEGDDRLPPDAEHLLDDDTRPVGRLQRLAEDDIVEGIVGIVDEIGVGVALDDREAARDAFVDAALADLDAAPVDPARRLEERQELAVAAADVEDARAGLDQLGDDEMVDAGDVLRESRC